MMVMVMIYPVVVLPRTSLAQRDRPCPCPSCICTYIPHLCSPPTTHPPPLTPTCFARPRLHIYIAHIAHHPTTTE